MKPTKHEQMEPIFFTPPCNPKDGRRVLYKGGGGSAPDYEGARVAERNRQREAFYAGTGYHSKRDAREAEYAKMREDIINYNKEKLNEEYQKALRNQQFNMARAGQTGGSQAIYEAGELKKKYDKALVDMGAKADEAVARARLGYENSINQGVSLINTGAQAATQIANALSQASAAMQEALAAAKGTSYGGLFESIGSAVENNQFRQAAASGYRGGIVNEDDKTVKPIGSSKYSGMTYSTR